MRVGDLDVPASHTSCATRSDLMEPTPHGSGSDEHGATARPAGRQREKTLAEQFADAEGLGDDDQIVVAPSDDTPGDLDDLFAELAGTRQAEPAADVEAASGS
jgi:hypothetical protein